MPAPIDVQVSGQNRAGNYAAAQRLAAQIERIPGAADVRVQQVMDAPEMRFNVDRTKAQQIGLSQRDVASDLLVSLSSSGQTAPNFWLNPANGVQYAVSVMTPQYKMASLDELEATPVAIAGTLTPQTFGNLASSSRGTTPAVVNHYNVQPVFDVFASADRRDLGGVARAIDAIIAKERDALPKGSQITMRGQVQSMRTSFTGLGLGIIFAILLVYIVLVVNFQSWLDPLIIIMALPGRAGGHHLDAVHHAYDVHRALADGRDHGHGRGDGEQRPAHHLRGRSASRRPHGAEAAVDAGFARLRPVCMTALAMIIGMLPMALGLGEGGEQNAPLGRAVIGGLLVATFFTLVIVPLIYSILRAGESHAGADRGANRRGRAGPHSRHVARALSPLTVVIMSNTDHPSPPDPHEPPEFHAHAYHADVGSAPPVQPMTARRLLGIGIGAAVVLVVLFIVTTIPRRSVESELRAEATARDSAPTVQVTTVHRAAAGSTLVLPGTIQALHESAIYARVQGYVKRWQADIGSLVRSGQLLAEIDAPELDHEVQQAQSQLSQTRAALGLAKADLERWRRSRATAPSPARSSTRSAPRSMPPPRIPARRKPTSGGSCRRASTRASRRRSPASSRRATWTSARSSRRRAPRARRLAQRASVVPRARAACSASRRRTPCASISPCPRRTRPPFVRDSRPA